MKELKNWNEISTGLYRYVISAGACYELLVMNWFEDTDIYNCSCIHLQLYILLGPGILRMGQYLVEN